ncbi:hypothetical protein D8M04_16730 [Oceanobacillus piezotolerans]|uniref:LRAT domain-containing protein n=1 Tax=Oceanobacillus piezotolerans TaxID=2448030 RepID=A0A498DIX6_9BACI|nr:hypothetical protein [Oceanobacillus piezotolerans]RLL41716.1 hypothetical protein D8M04_16730 [Oceanobacillus piezotolerans]
MDIKLQDDPIHYYPGTSIKMVPGDILYSHKLAFSSFIVAHEAIIGEDYRIYHVNRWGSIGHSDSMPIYLSRHRKKEKLTILRYPDPTIARKAAIWARGSIGKVKTYTFNREVANIANNYCSKFIWQAFYCGSNCEVDLHGSISRYKEKAYITPIQLYRNLEVIGSFRNR